EPVYLQDIMATSLDLAGAERPDHVQFQSLKPILAGEKGGYPSIYGGYLKSQRAVTQDGHKLILYPNVPKALLFDLRSDPQEMHDLLEGNADPSAKEKAGKLFDEFLKLQRENGDALELKRDMFPELK
ncbi:MAG: choline-sulfatase, partial [Verrucomicrobiae bacterium]|nr:choline-sulfatase [Verrucomicrobiae bacterium]